MSVNGRFTSFSKTMLISVVIPTCHRNDLLSKCLDRLAPVKQAGGECFEDGNRNSEVGSQESGVRSQESDSCPSLFSYEVVVTDDGSRTTAQELIQCSYPWANWVAGPRKGPAANRNNGAKNAKGEWLIFLDDDCLPNSLWLNAIWTDASTGAFDVIEGKTVTPDKVDNPFRQGVENLTGGNYWSCNLAVRREVFLEFGGYDEDFLEAGGEDMEFAFRIRKNNLRVHFNENALVLHPTRRLGWRQLVWRTRLDRWMLLYRNKTGDALPPGASSLNIVLCLFRTQIMGRLRGTFHLFSKPDSALWRTRLFFQVWNWLAFPIVFPYLVKWEFRFRRQFFSGSKNNYARSHARTAG